MDSKQANYKAAKYVPTGSYDKFIHLELHLCYLVIEWNGNYHNKIFDFYLMKTIYLTWQISY